MVLTWWASTLPMLGIGWVLLARAWRGGPPWLSGDLLALFSLSALLVLAAAWYAMGAAFMLHQARAALEGRPHRRLPSPGRLVDDLAPMANALGARLLLSCAALIPLGAALPLARIASATWPISAVLGPPLQRRWLPPLSVVLISLASWSLVILITVNLAVLLSWLRFGSLLESSQLLSRLSDPASWLLALALALSVVEPWRALALVSALYPPGPARPATGHEEAS